MGGGAPRELSKQFSTRELDPDIEKRLAVALGKLDGLDEKFKMAREDEFNAQMTKKWMDVNIVLCDHLREVGHVMINALQIALESGSEGGGTDATPWVEEGGGALPRLEFRLMDNKVTAVSDNKVLATCVPDRNLPYEWVERVVAKWILYSVKSKVEG